MAQRQSIIGWGKEANRPAARGTPGSRPASRTHGLITVAIGALLCWATTSVSAATGPGLALKVGAQTLDSPIDGEKTTRARIEGEISSALQGNGHLDVYLAVGGSPLGSSDFADVYEADGVLYEDFYSDTFSLIDVRLGARLYPFGRHATIRPHVGGGIGYYWLRDSYDDQYYATTEDPLFPGSFITYADYASDTETVGDGLFPFVTAGLSVPVASNFELLFEFEYDFAKDDAGVDLGGPIYMFGARIRL